MSRKLLLDDIADLRAYERERPVFREHVIELKRRRRVSLGTVLTLLFETRDTIRFQIQEMARVEKLIRDEQIQDELDAYNPLIPQGSELTATFMIEIDDPIRRARVLDGLGAIENSAFIRVGGETIQGVAEADQDRKREDGKASSVQFVHFAFTPAQVAAFKQPGAEVVLGFSHRNYGHMAAMAENIRAELAGDFD